MEKQGFRFKIVVMLTVTVACIAFFLFQTGSNKQESGLQAGSDEEARLESALEAIQGVGKVKVYFHYEGQAQGEKDSVLFSQYFSQQTEKPQSISGLLVVAEGADDVFIRGELEVTISRILQLPSHRIVIVPMKDEEDVKE